MKTIKQLQVEDLIQQTLTLPLFDHEMSKIGIYVVTPGDTVSMVYFNDERRYFPLLNEDDIVVGGYFG